MLDREFRPCALLAPYVHLIWSLESDDPTLFGGSHRIFPDGIVEVVFHYGEPFVTRFGDAFEEVEPRFFAISQTSRFIDIRPTGRCGLISVRFLPWGAHQFFSVPVSEFADRQIPASCLWGDDAAIMEDRIQSARTVEERVALVERFLLKQLERHHDVDGEIVVHLIRRIWQRRGQVAVRELTREFGISERQLQRRLLHAMGAPPKQIARIARFLHACHQVRSRQGSLTEIAHSCGYYDQSHFIRDFKSLSGLTPGQLSPSSQVSFLNLD